MTLDPSCWLSQPLTHPGLSSSARLSCRQFPWPLEKGLPARCTDGKPKSGASWEMGAVLWGKEGEASHLHPHFDWILGPPDQLTILIE